MAFDLERGSVFRPWVLLIMLALIQVVSAQFCSFWNTDCIDTLAQTAVSFDFQPLFPDPVYLYYGFDARSSRRIKSPITKTGFWLRYQNHVNRATVDANRTSEIGLRVGNLAGMPSGNNNGCDGIWGPTCSADFKSALRHNMYRIAVSGTYYSKPLKRALSQMLLNPPQLPSCPPTILDVASIPVQGMTTSERCFKSQPPWDSLFTYRLCRGTNT